MFIISICNSLRSGKQTKKRPLQIIAIVLCTYYKPPYSRNHFHAIAKIASQTIQAYIGAISEMTLTTISIIFIFFIFLSPIITYINHKQTHTHTHTNTYTQTHCIGKLTERILDRNWMILKRIGIDLVIGLYTLLTWIVGTRINKHTHTHTHTRPLFFVSEGNLSRNHFAILFRLNNFSFTTTKKEQKII